MHFAKTYSQLLLTLPDELRENAISYRQLKKLINQIVVELHGLGLSPSVLNSLLVDQVDGSIMNESLKGGGSAKGKARAFGERPDEVRELAELLRGRAKTRAKTGGTLQGDVQEDGPEENGGGASKVVYEIASDGEAIQPRLRVWLDDPEPITSHPRQSTQRAYSQQVIIPLASDTAFFTLLQTALTSLSTYLSRVHTDFTTSLHALALSVSHTARPHSASSPSSFKPASFVSGSTGAPPSNPLLNPLSFSSSFISGFGKSDLYAWREIFQIYVDTEVFVSTHEMDRGERDVGKATERLALFERRLRERGLMDSRKLRLKESREALREFLRLNVRILDLKKFELASMEACRKILKKHAKRTALRLPAPSPNSPPNSISDPKYIDKCPTALVHSNLPFPILNIQDPLLALVPRPNNQTPGLGTLPRTLIQSIAEILLPIIPHIDDYECLICTSIAFKPIRLGCGHLFCVRCLVKMQKRGNGNCPICRAETVLQANRNNVDWAVLNFMQDWFPRETRAKLRHNEREAAREELAEMGVKDDCVIC